MPQDTAGPLVSCDAPGVARAWFVLGLGLVGSLAGCGQPGAADPDAAVPDATAALDVPIPACSGREVELVTGRVLDEAGAPVAGARPQLCVRLHADGRLVCLAPPTAEADGSFSIRVPVEARCMSRAAMRVLLPASRFATAYCPVSLDAAEGGALAIQPPFTLHDVPLATTPPLGDPSAVRAVELGGVLSLTMSPEAVGGEGDYARLGARALDPTSSCVPEARGLSGLVAATPEASDLGAPFRVRADGLTPGEAVDLFVIGGLATRLADGTEVEEAALARFGSGVVSADGWIDPDDGVRLPHLGWLGWAPVQ